MTAVAVVEGEVGIGKTRLLGEALRLAGGAGARTLSARASELERSYGFGVVRQLFDLIAADPSVEVTVDLEAQRVTAAGVGDLPGVDVAFDIHPHTRHCLLNGLDDIALTLQQTEAIKSYEDERERSGPVTTAL